ncbi:hypothetical protein A2T98_16785 [Nodularia spumigena CENA596]|uniref:Methyltransferase FkbM domain-containing protein n=1 Tax=Nodularia spumigena CENA596 TaxID=1819295 RepID=A0A166IPM2_NODSP|nr:FkbM family methyltransferase [Nodularia spumigena]KZL48676.1 hypothetical protein A2T98_16785 [Nodularia spumigena CENA596]
MRFPQGAELEVLKGGAAVLSRGVLAIETEVEFSPIYLNQPLFADIDVYLREHDFTLFDLRNSYRVRARSPIASTRQGQLLWGEAFYFQDPIAENNNCQIQEPERIFKLACIADILGFPDYALELLEYLTVNYGTNPEYNFADTIIESLSNFPELVKMGLDSLAVVANIRSFLKN